MHFALVDHSSGIHIPEIRQALAGLSELTPLRKKQRHEHSDQIEQRLFVTLGTSIAAVFFFLMCICEYILISQAVSRQTTCPLYVIVSLKSLAAVATTLSHFFVIS